MAAIPEAVTPGRIRLHSQCHICNGNIGPGKRCAFCESIFILKLSTATRQSRFTNLCYHAVKVRSNEDGTNFDMASIIPDFESAVTYREPDSPSGHSCFQQLQLNRHQCTVNVSWCREFHSGLEMSATFHVDCLQLFMNTCPARDAMERLWTAVIWRDPFSAGMRIPLRFARGAASVSGVAFATVAEMCGLSIMRLPREVRDMIQEYMHGHLLWCYMAVLDMAWRLSSGSASANPLRSVPLHHVLEGVWPSANPGCHDHGLDLEHALSP